MTKKHSTSELATRAQRTKPVSCSTSTLRREQQIDWPMSALSDCASSQFVEHLLALPIDKLREVWTESNPTIAIPDRLPRDILVRDLVWRRQVEEFGGLSSTARSTLNKMSRELAVTGTLDIERSVRPKPGTRLIREWRGKTYIVEATEEGFLYDCKAFASLSHVARAITGTRWSGPRFFGLRPQDRDDDDGGIETRSLPQKAAI